MPSDYVIQVVHIPTKKVAGWAPGLEVEKDLITELIDRVQDKGVGLFRTEAHVLKDVEAALRELLFELKSSV